MRRRSFGKRMAGLVLGVVGRAYVPLIALAFEEPEPEAEAGYFSNTVHDYDKISPGDLEAPFYRHWELSTAVCRSPARTAVFT